VLIKKRVKSTRCYCFQQGAHHLLKYQVPSTQQHIRNKIVFVCTDVSHDEWGLSRAV